MQLVHKPTILIILDGWGHTDTTDYNAIYSANKPIWDRIWNEYPHTLINASGLDVGLPPSQITRQRITKLFTYLACFLRGEFTAMKIILLR